MENPIEMDYLGVPPFISKYWLVVWNMFYFAIIYGIILPIDFHIFQEGLSHHQPVNMIDVIFTHLS